MELLGALTGNLFGIDSKCIEKRWILKNGVEKRMKIPIGVCVNPIDNERFESEYDNIMNDLFNEFKLEKGRSTYCSSEIGRMFPTDSPDYSRFCLAFTRRIMNLKNVKFTFFVTTINKKCLPDEEIIINGEYGSTTEKISVERFIDKISNSYNIICAWGLLNKLNMSKQTIIIDGTSVIIDCKAWDYIKKYHNIKITYNADKTVRVVSTADIILRNLDFFLRQEKSVIDEHTIKKIIHYNDKIPTENCHYMYIGNPQLKYIKPNSDRNYTSFDLKEYYQKPMIYLYAGEIEGQKQLFDDLPDELMNYASDTYANIKIFDPKNDMRIIGRNKDIPDLFYSLNTKADETFEALRRMKRNIKKFEM